MPVYEILQELTLEVLVGVAAWLRDSPRQREVNMHALGQIAGAQAAESLASLMGAMRERGWKPEQIATLLDAAIELRRPVEKPCGLFDLVLSGPSFEGVYTRDTLAVIQSMMADAQEDVMIAGYAFHNGKTLFSPLARKVQAETRLKVSFYLNVLREKTNRSLSPADVDSFVRSFLAENWPWDPVPEIYYDARCLTDEEGVSSLHGKCLICDRKKALISSANFTEAAQKRNIEIGLLVDHEPTILTLTNYFAGLVEIEVIKKWKAS